MNYLKQKATQKASGILPKAGTFFQATKSPNCMEIILTLHKNMTGNLLLLKWQPAESDVSGDRSMIQL